MFRSDAQRVHTEVIDRGTVRNRADMKLIGKPMRIPLHPHPVFTLDSKDAVSALGHNAHPLPTCHTLPYALFKPSTYVTGASTSISTLHAVNYTTHYTEYIGQQLMEHLRRAVA